jgi:hypothetical protein
MARYKAIDTSPRFLTVDLEKQPLPDSFEYAVHHLLEREFNLSLFNARYCNDQSGATAYPPGMLLKVILCAYAQGVVSSRGIERLCQSIPSGSSIAWCTTSRNWRTTGTVNRKEGQFPRALRTRRWPEGESCGRPVKKH